MSTRRIGTSPALRGAAGLAAWLVVWGAVTLGCGGHAGEGAAPVTPAPVITTDSGTVEAGAGSSGSCTEVTRVPPAAGPSRELSAAERQRADRLVAAAEKAVRDSAFRDVDVLVEQGRLELWRNSTEKTAYGVNDVDRAHRNGQRAMAVDHGQAPGRLLIALTTASRVNERAKKRDPRDRWVVLGLVELAIQMALDGAPDVVAAAGQTMLGYLWLDRGQALQAAQAFDAALALDGEAAGAWVGKGHVARAQEDLAAAAAAYRRALALDADDLEARSALAATQRCEGLQLNVGFAPSLVSPRLTRDPLMPPAPQPSGACPPIALAEPRSRQLCLGRGALARAHTDADRKTAADQIIAGWRDLKQACEAGEPVCGPHVVPTLLEASNALHTVGQLARSLALGKLLSDPRYPAFQAAGIQGEVALLMGDRYYQMGVYDLAATYYERHVRHARAASTARAAQERALAIVVALGQVDAARRLASEVATDRNIPEAQRAGAVLATAGLIRADHGPRAARSFLDPHRQLFDTAGLGAVAAELGSGSEAGGAAHPFLFAQAVRRLAADPRWSPAAQRIAEQVPNP